MAGSKSGRFTTTGITVYGYSGYESYIDWEITSQGLNGSTPYSVVKVSWSMKRTSTNVAAFNNGNPPYEFTFDGSVAETGTKNYNTSQWTVNQEYLLWSKSFTVNHNSAGSRSVAMSMKFTGAPMSPSPFTTGGTAVLLDIPMASKIASLSPTTINLGSSSVNLVTNITRYSNSYYHKLTYKIGNTVVATRNAGQVASYTFAVAPADWLPRMASASSASCTVTLETYSNSGYTTKVGDASTATFTINATANPTASISAAPRGNAYNKGVSTTLFYNGQSTALLTFSGAGVQSSTITKLEVYQNNALIRTVNNPSGSQTYTTGVLSGTSITFKVIATDSRGRTAQATITVTLQAYSAPTITNATAYRCNSSGTADSGGTYLRVQATANATGSGNSITSFKVNTRTSGGSAVQSNVNITSGTAQTIGSGQYAVNTSYVVEFVATDKMGYTATITRPINTASRIINVRDGGTGLAFGKFSEKYNYVDSAWYGQYPGIDINEPLSDYAELKFLPRGNQVGTVTGQTATNWNRLYFQVRQMQGNTVYRDGYFLPNKAAGDYTTHDYDILTTKNLVTVAQGGTGQSGIITATSGIITATTGTVTAQYIAKWGKIAQLRWAAKPAAAVPAGGNAFMGTLTEGNRPINNINNATYYGSVGMVVNATPTGEVTVRVISGTLPSDAEIGLTLIYLLQ